MEIQKVGRADSLADILEKILDKGIVIAGDIKISIGDVELLQIKIRLIIASVDKAMEMGIDWWTMDSSLSSKAKVNGIEEENRRLKEELNVLKSQEKL